jgi:hypothetical protein
LIINRFDLDVNFQLKLEKKKVKDVESLKFYEHALPISKERLASFKVFESHNDMNKNPPEIVLPNKIGNRESFSSESTKKKALQQASSIRSKQEKFMENNVKNKKINEKHKTAKLRMWLTKEFPLGFSVR